MMNWTDAQKKVIFSHGKTVIVAAGAGAGKTSCLTERILEGIDGGTDITDMLVVTFTKAAASDIRAKLYEKLSDRIALRPEDKRLYTQLAMLAVADISTVDAFCYRIVKQNFQALGLSPTLRVIGNSEVKSLKRKCADAMMNEFYENGGDAFTSFVAAFSKPRSDNDIADTVIDIYDRIGSFPDPFGYLEKCEKRIDADCESAGSGASPTEQAVFAAVGALIKKYTLHAAKAEKASMSFDEGISRVFATHAELSERLTSAYGAGRYGDVRDLTLSPSFPQMRSKECTEEEKKALTNKNTSLKNELKRISELLSYSRETLESQSAASLGFFRTLRAMITRYDELFRRAKEEKNSCDYSDLEHFTLKLLTDSDTNGESSPSELCLRLRKQIKQLYIDEYQDINPLQDSLFTLLSDGRNRFMVGDVKQSIYRFRHAEPDIFTSYVASFPAYDDSENETGKLYLSENFRSGAPVIDFVNAVFRALLPESYTKEEQLVCALGEKGGGEKPVFLYCGDADAEARAVADEISSLVGTYVKRDGELLRYGDCALLLASPSVDSGAFMREMKKRNIPYICERSTDFLESPEVLLMTSLLRCIDNPLDDISLACALRSEVFGFDADDLLAVRSRYRASSLYESLYMSAHRKTGMLYRVSRRETVNKASVRRARKIRRGCGALADKATEALSKLNYYRSCAPRMPVHELIWHIFTTTSLLGNDGDASRKNLLILYSQARSFEGGAYRGLSPFVEFYRDVYDGQDDADGTFSSANSGDCVHIMSVHKSKGLDFPAVFLSRCSKGANRHDSYKNILVSRTKGISFTYFDTDTKTRFETLAHKASSIDENDATDKERTRLLYVALTRAKELLYLSGTTDYAPDSFTAMISNAEVPAGILERRYPDAPDVAFEAEAKKDESKAGKTVSEEYARKALAFVYPYSSAPRAKISVSELDGESFAGAGTLVSRSVVRTKPSFVSETVSGAERGTAMHEFMQFASFENVERFGVLYEAQSLVARRMITVQQMKLLDKNALERFFSSELYALIRKSPKVYREKRFSIIENGEYFGRSNDSEVLVQGVIDLFFMNDDGTYTVVDYKTDAARYSDRATILRSHETQLRYYCRAVREMTGAEVTGAVIYAFSLSEKPELPLTL